MWKVLKLAMSKLGQQIKVDTVNPKSMPRTQLLGHIDLDTREWTDGVLTNMARQVVKLPLVSLFSLVYSSFLILII